MTVLLYCTVQVVVNEECIQYSLLKMKQSFYLVFMIHDNVLSEI